jgi:2,3-bisphosphoglycerate-independent phosphoglycerate mutase
MLNTKKYNKVVLIVLDGFGVATPSRGNAISLAGVPVLDQLVRNYPSTALQASGPLVGLPWGEMGNSEVGHLNIGAGRIVGQDLPRINNAIQSGSFFTNPALVGACKHALNNNSSLHLMGLASKGAIHGSIDHLYALLGLAEQFQVPRVFIHFFTDGRDTAERVALDDILTLREKLKMHENFQIASLSGRFYAMDRGGHWSQTERTYNAIVNGEGATGLSAEEVVESSYSRGVYDEMIEPTVVTGPDGQPVGKVKDGDAVIFFNFRQDRALQLTQAFVEPDKTPLAGKLRQVQDLYFCTMVEYRPGLAVQVAFASQELSMNLAEYIASQGFTQFHAAESEKYAHVTSFFNCGRTELFPGEERQIVKSPANNENYAASPAMAALELTSVVVDKITKSSVNFIVANFANADMVGHTGDMNACLAAVRIVDECLGKISEASLQADAALVITADHGNIEQIIDPHTGDIDKDHTTSPVPFILVANELKSVRKPRVLFEDLSGVVPEGVISDVAPTILALFKLDKPSQMSAINLLESL